MNSSLKLCDGPVIVSKETLDFVDKVQKPLSYSTKYYYWIDESNDAEIRRVMLRQLLRDRDRCNEIMQIGGCGENKVNEFYWMLKNRPVLQHEIIEEFIYNLENDFYPKKVNLPNHGYLNLLIFLTTVADEKTAKHLWDFYYLDEVYPENYDGMESLCRLAYETPRLSDSILLDIWAEMARRLENENEQVSKLDHEPDNVTPQTCALVSCVRKLCWHLSNAPQIVPLEDFLLNCIDWLETHIPDEVSYLGDLGGDTDNVIHVLSRIDIGVAVDCAERVVLHGDNLDGLYSHDFLYWLYGIIANNGAKPETLAKIQNLFYKEAD